LANAKVSLSPPPSRFGPQPWEILTTTTDGNGGFTFWGLKEGLFYLSAVRGGFIPDRGPQPSVDLPKETEAVVLRMMPQAVIRGSVFDEDGDLPDNIAVGLEGRANRGVPYDARVRPDGTFVIGGILPGRYYVFAASSESIGVKRAFSPMKRTKTFYPGTVTVDDAKYFDVAPGQQIDGVSFRIKTAPMFRVRLRLENLDPQAFVFPRAGNPPVEAVYKLADGSLEFRLRKGNYLFVGTGHSPSEPQKTFTRLVAVDRDIDDLVVSAKDTVYRLRGVLRDEQGKLAALLNGMRPSLDFGVSDPGRWGSSYQFIDAEFTSTAGEWPPTLPVHADFHPGVASYFVKSMLFDGKDISRDFFEMPPSGGEVVITVSDGAAVVKGKALDAYGKPSRNARVSIWSSRYSATVAAAADGGGFTFENVPPDSYLIATWDDVDEDLPANPAFYRGFESVARRMELKPGSVEKPSLTTIPRESWEHHAKGLR
jgi:hypothetical protein